MAEIKDSRFRVVGAGWQKAAPSAPHHKRAKRLPIVSLLLLTSVILGCLFAPLLVNHDPQAFYLDSLNEPPSRIFYFGTDALGRDLYAMIWYGGRVSIAVGLMGMSIISVIGIVYGCVSGLASERIDAVLMRMVELMNSIPQLLLVLLLGAVVPKHNSFTLALLIGITGWFDLARLVRSEVRRIRSCEYLLAARYMGVRFDRLLLVYLLPNLLPTILFPIISSVSLSISMESTLSFLGLGLPVEVVSWGSMLSLANRALLLNTWWVIVIPGIFLLATIGCITSIGNYFRKEIHSSCSNL
ncbi:MAG: ABC transporter permease [Anaerotruncus sp.]|nr:ABC transporter permease [Anaerotruncus sp.]